MIAFIAAERREFDGLLRHLTKARGLRLAAQWSVAGELNGKSVVLAANGPGPVLAGLAADAVKEYQSVEALVSYGFCGGLDARLAVNDIFVATEVVGTGRPCVGMSADAARTSACATRGKLLSVDRVVSTSVEKVELHEAGADAVEMEAAAVASRARAWGIPFYCIRVVTDSARDEFGIDFNRVRDSDGRFSRWKIIAAAFRNPFKLFPELIRLDCRTKSAAKVLGDFVATCEF